MTKIAEIILDKKNIIVEKKLEEVLNLFPNIKDFSIEEEKEFVTFLIELLSRKIKYIKKYSKMKQSFLEELKNELMVKELSLEPNIMVQELSHGYLLQTADIIDKLGLEQFGKFICLFNKEEILVKSFPLESGVLFVDERNCYIIDIAKTCEHFQYVDDKWECVQIFGNVALVESLSSKLKQIRHTSGSYSLYNQETNVITVINYDNLNTDYLPMGEYNSNEYYQLEKFIIEEDYVDILTFFVNREGEISSKIIDLGSGINYLPEQSLIDIYHQSHNNLKKILKK